MDTCLATIVENYSGRNNFDDPFYTLSVWSKPFNISVISS